MPLATMSDTPEVILASHMAAFTGLADEGRATDGVTMCSKDFTLDPDSGENNLEQFKMMMQARQASNHETRHSIGWPIVSEASAEKVAGRAPMTVYRLENEQFSVNVVDIHMSVIKEDGEWKVYSFQVMPFRGAFFS